MNNFIRSFKTALLQMCGKSDGVSISDIRPARLIYCFAYAFELTLYSVLTAFLPMGVDLMGVSAWTIAYALHMAASLAVMLLWSKRFKPLIWISVIVMVVGFVPMIFLPMGYARFIFGCLALVGLGGAVTSARCGFAFAANNAERLIGMVVMFFAAAAVRFVALSGMTGVFMTHILPLFLVAALAYCLLHFREQDMEVKEVSTKSDRNGLYWALAYFMAFFGIDGYSGALIDIAAREGHEMYILGMIVAGMLLFGVFVWLKLNVWHLWNLFFLFAIGMGLLAVFAPQLDTKKPSSLFNGLSCIGWPLSIYMLACAQRRFASYRLLKQCTVLFVLLSPVTTLSSRLMLDFYPTGMAVISLLYILAVTVAFLMLSPFSYQHLFSALWLSDIYKTDMALLQEKVKETDFFGKYGLTPRQKEVAVLLLAAKTRRQIAGELGLSESTVKMHAADLYRKLNINSRTELFRLFSVAEANKERNSG